MVLAELLGSSITIGLSDKANERRALAARELESKVQRTCASGSSSSYSWVGECIVAICDELLASTHANSRKGGLVALASVSLGLRGNLSDDHVRVVLSRCLQLLNDEDAHVRYFACESSFNVLKVCRISALMEFKGLFDAVCKLLGDSEQDNRQAAPVLDRLLKEVVAEYFSTHHDFCDVVSILECHLLLPSVFVKQLCLSWIPFLRQLKECLFMERISKFLPFLFSVLSADFSAPGRRDLAVSAESVFAELLVHVSEMSQAAVDQTSAVLLRYAQFQETLGAGNAKIILFTWILKLGPLTLDSDLCADLAAAVVRSLDSTATVVSQAHDLLLHNGTFKGKVVASSGRLAQSLEAVVSGAPSERVSAGAVEWLLAVSEYVRMDNMDVLFSLRMDVGVLRLAIRQFRMGPVVDRLVSSGRFIDLISTLLEASKEESLLSEVLAEFLNHPTAANEQTIALISTVFEQGLGSTVFVGEVAKRSVSLWREKCSVAAFAVGVFASVDVTGLTLASATTSELEALVGILELSEFEKVRVELVSKPELVKLLVSAAMRLDQNVPAFSLLFNRLQLVSVFRSL